VLVRDSNVDQALRVLKKKMQREGVFREMKRRRFLRSRLNGATVKRRRRCGAPASSRASNTGGISSRAEEAAFQSRTPLGRTVARY
jgi:small subunit ribosomal protein S21